MNMQRGMNILRFFVVFFAGFVCAWVESLGAVHFMRSGILRGGSLYDLALTSLGAVFIGGALVLLACATLNTMLYSLFSTTSTLPSAVPILEAMKMIHAHTNREQIAAIKYYKIRVFRANKDIDPEGEQEISCKEISGYFYPIPMILGFDKFFALGSRRYCCDKMQVEEIIATNQARWGTGTNPEIQDAVTSQLLDKSVELEKQKREATQKYTAAAGRESKLRGELEAAEKHMGILVKLAHQVTKGDGGTSRPLTKEEIKRKYVNLGKPEGITDAPNKYVELFRRAMPTDYVNWGGAPSQDRGA